MSVKLVVPSVGNGKDSLTGKEADGLMVQFDGGKMKFLSWKSFRQILTMELAEHRKEEPGLFPEAKVIGNGPAAAVPVK